MKLRTCILYLNVIVLNEIVNGGVVGLENKWINRVQKDYEDRFSKKWIKISSKK